MAVRTIRKRKKPETKMSSRMVLNHLSEPFTETMASPMAHKPLGRPKTNVLDLENYVVEMPPRLLCRIGWRIGWNKLANRLVRKKEREDLQRYLFTWEVALKPSNANVNAISALRHALNGAAIVFAGPFVALNGTLNGSVPFYGPNFVLDGEVGR